MKKIMKIKKPNLFMILQWIVFIPLLLPLGMITGAIDGVKKTFNRAAADIFDESDQELAELIDPPHELSV